MSFTAVAKFVMPIKNSVPDAIMLSNVLPPVAPVV
jgi:hypothetical protein